MSINSNFKEFLRGRTDGRNPLHQSEKTAQTRQYLPEFIHNLGPKAMKILITIYNKLWSSRENLPNEWKKAIIVPILKPNKPANLVSSYRPMALTSTLAKIQERMILA